MSAIVARVQNGRLELDEPIDLPDGTTVQLYIVDQGDDLDDEDRRALEDAIDEAAESVARGETISTGEVPRLLDADG
jgi:hypothetical protein